MKYQTIMKKIKYSDQVISSLQKEDKGYDKVIDVMTESKKVAHNMVLYLKKCEEDGFTFEEAEEMLENYMLEKGEQ